MNDLFERFITFAENRGARIAWTCLAICIIYAIIKTVYDIANGYIPTL